MDEGSPVATALAGRHGYAHQPYFGPALLAYTDDGATAGFTGDQLAATLDQLRDLDL